MSMMPFLNFYFILFVLIFSTIGDLDLSLDLGLGLGSGLSLGLDPFFVLGLDYCWKHS